MSFFRHPEIYRSDVFNWSGNGVPAAPGLIVCDEFPAGYSSANCSPAGSASASPTADHFALKSSCRSMVFHRTANSVLTVCLSSGGHPSVFLSVEDLQASIAAFLAAWNESPKPFVWTATVESIQEKLTRCRRTLEQIKPGCTSPKTRKRRKIAV